MRASHLASLAALIVALFVVSVPAGAGTVGGIPSDVLDNVGSTSTSSGGCVPPSAAVDLYGLAAQETDIDFAAGGDAEKCDELCDKLRQTCREIANTSKRCNNDGGGSFADLQRTACKQIDDKKDQKSCKAEVDFLRETVRDCVNADRDRAFACCDLQQSFCLAECAGPDNVSVPQCFTGPGGYAGGTCFFNLFNQTVE